MGTLRFLLGIVLLGWLWPIAAAASPSDLSIVQIAQATSNNRVSISELTRAAETGNADAQFKLGVVYHFGKGAEKNYDKALHWYRKAARQGHGAAANNLGNMYNKGLGVIRDRKEAVHWFRKAARQGHRAGQYNLGQMYQRGLGVQRDREEAIYWYRKSSAQGFKLAEKQLKRLETGNVASKGLSPSNVERLRQQAKAGDPKSQHQLGMLYFKGKLGIRDFEQAAYWWQKAADQGFAASQGGLGALYLSGKGVKKDGKLGIEWMKKAAQQGDPGAQNNLAQILAANGKLEPALKLSQAAVKQKSDDGRYWHTLAVILAKYGEKDAAFKAWDRALSLSPNNTKISETAKKYGYSR